MTYTFSGWELIALFGAPFLLGVLVTGFWVGAKSGRRCEECTIDRAKKRHDECTECIDGRFKECEKCLEGEGVQCVAPSCKPN